MFTLKLYRRVNPDKVITKIVTCHHVQTMTFEHADDRPGYEHYDPHKALELWAFHGPEPSTYDSYLIGDRERHVPSVSDVGVVARPADDWYGWGLLENEAGKTTEHFRPASFG
jgi:hypothetical protein